LLVHNSYQQEVKTVSDTQRNRKFTTLHKKCG
jgi:hypothetical protein